MKSEDIFYKTQQFFYQFRNHWAFWPFLIQLLFGSVYLLFFAENGLLAYKERLAYKHKIEKNIQKLEATKKKLKSQLKNLQDSKKALKSFSKKYLFIDKKIKILKFIDQKQKKKIKQAPTENNIDSIRFWYLVIATTILIIVWITFWLKREQKTSPHHFADLPPR